MQSGYCVIARVHNLEDRQMSYALPPGQNTFQPSWRNITLPTPGTNQPPGITQVTPGGGQQTPNPWASMPSWLQPNSGGGLFGGGNVSMQPWGPSQPGVQQGPGQGRNMYGAGWGMSPWGGGYGGWGGNLGFGGMGGGLSGLLGGMYGGGIPGYMSGYRSPWGF